MRDKLAAMEKEVEIPDGLSPAELTEKGTRCPFLPRIFFGLDQAKQASSVSRQETFFSLVYMATLSTVLSTSLLLGLYPRKPFYRFLPMYFSTYSEGLSTTQTT